MRLAVSILAVSVFVTGIFAFVSPHKPADAQSSARSPHKPPVALEHPIFANGVVEGKHRETPLRFEVPGRISTIPVREGQKVELGDTLARLEAATWEQSWAEAEASLMLARAERERLVNGASKEARAFARAQLHAAKAKAQQVTKRFERASELRKSNAIASQDYDDIEGDLRSAQAMLEAATARADELDAPPRDDELDMADAKIGRELARTEYAAAMLAKTVLKAPSSGTILRIQGEVGELAGPNSPEPTITFVDTSAMHVRAFVEEMDALRVAPGQHAYATPDGAPGLRLAGTVIACSPCMVPKKVFSNAPGERADVKVREVLIELDRYDDLVVDLRVDVFIEPATGE